MKNINKITKQRLCTGCGACAFLCKHIRLTDSNGYNVAIADKVCNQCGQCLSVCQAHESTEKFNNKNITDLIDNVETYTAYSKNNDIRLVSASGGFITQLLCDFMDNNIIDGCIIAYSDGTFENTKAIVATTKEEILLCKSSKYCPIPMVSALKNIDKNKKYVFVGKGCDINALRLLQKRIKFLNNAIFLTIGIMCAKTPSVNASKILYKDMTGKDYEKSVSKLFYRVDGWPGEAIALYRNSKYRLPYTQSWGGPLSHSSYSKHCQLCINHFCTNADIAIGDAWHKNKKLENGIQLGENIVISYNAKLESFTTDCPNIMIEKCSKNDILYAQENLFKIQEKAFLYSYFTKKSSLLYKIKNLASVIKLLFRHNYKFAKFCIGLCIRRKDY